MDMGRDMVKLSTKGLVAIGVALLGVGSVARGQMPAIPGVPPLPSAASSLGGEALAAAPGGFPAAPAQPTLWGFFGITPQNCAACRQKICASPLGSMLNGLLGPGSAMTGGLVPMFCPAVPTDAQLAALAAAGGPTGAEAVAAKIKQDEADAKARHRDSLPLDRELPLLARGRGRDHWWPAGRPQRVRSL